jgi:hypothetical protein
VGGIAVDDNGLYFGGRDDTKNLATIWRIPADGSAGATVATLSGRPGRIVANGGFLYWADDITPAVWQSDATGSPLVELFTGAGGKNSPQGIAVLMNRIYFTDGYTGEIGKATRSFAGSTVIATGPSGASGIAVDDTSVYWATLCGRILRAPN